jgi:hypothetical protein
MGYAKNDTVKLVHEFYDVKLADVSQGKEVLHQ